MKTLEFIKLKENETFEGVFEGFGKNKYGPFIIIDGGEKLKCLSLQSAVLANLVKSNLDYFKKGVNIKITKLPKPQGKKYFNFNVFINGEEISLKYEIDIEELKNLLS